MLISPSEFRATDFPSPVPFNRLGVLFENWYVGVAGNFCFRRPAERGLGGRLEIRPSPRGGCGNAAMLEILTTFLIDLPGVPMPETPDTVLGAGRAPVGAGRAGGGNAADGARSPVFGVLGVDRLVRVGTPPVLFRVLPTGRAGRALVGGPFDGREGRGRAADIMSP